MEKVYVSKYALSTGITVLDGEIRKGEHYEYVHERYQYLVVGRDCFLSEDEAIKDAEKKRLAKIKSLKKSLAKVEGLSFSSKT